MILTLQLDDGSSHNPNSGSSHSSNHSGVAYVVDFFVASNDCSFSSDGGRSMAITSSVSTSQSPRLLLAPPPSPEQLLADYPDLLYEVLIGLTLPTKPPGYSPEYLEWFCDDVWVAGSSPAGTMQLNLPHNYRPYVISCYGDDELLLVKVQDTILLNRLPVVHIKAEWETFPVAS